MHVAEFLDAVGVVFAGPGSYSWGLTQDLRPGLSDAAPPGLEPGSAPDDGCTLKIPTSRTEREKWGTRRECRDPSAAARERAAPRLRLTICKMTPLSLDAKLSGGCTRGVLKQKKDSC
jgi:hypothetical protein